MNELQQLWHLLNRAPRKSAVLMLCLMLIGMVLEMMGKGRHRE
jgi:hypothetical protein